MEQLDELELEKGEDAPMSMATNIETKTVVCGINSAEDKLKSGSNQNCRNFTIEDGKCVPVALSYVSGIDHSYLCNHLELLFKLVPAH